LYQQDEAALVVGVSGMAAVDEVPIDKGDWNHSQSWLIVTSIFSTGCSQVQQVARGCTQPIVALFSILK